MNNNNPLAEIGLLVLSVAIIAAMTVLLIFGKIDYIEAIPFLTVVAGLFGVNVAAKAPSPSQQQQLSDQQAGLQQLIAQLTSTILPAVFQAHTHPANQVQNSLQTLSNIGGGSPTSPAARPVASTPIQVATPVNATNTPTQLFAAPFDTTTSVQPMPAQTQFMPSPLAAAQPQTSTRHFGDTGLIPTP